MLPMFPRRPVLLGGVIAIKSLWSSLIYGGVEFLNPVLSTRINWPWFVISQVGFGIVAGVAGLNATARAHKAAFPFAVRAGFEAPGAMGKSDEEDLQRWYQEFLLTFAVLAGAVCGACSDSPGRPGPRAE